LAKNWTELGVGAAGEIIAFCRAYGIKAPLIPDLVGLFGCF